MRISSSLYFQTGLNSINRQQSELMHIFQQVGTGKRMITAADDPLAAAQTITLSQAQGMNKRFAENRQVAIGMLSEEENILNSLTTQLQDVKTRLVEAANGSLSDADRATLANALRSNQESLLGLANATDSSGQYLFSGGHGKTAPFEVQKGVGASYKGDRVDRNIQIDQTRLISGSDNGFDVFSRAAPGVSSFITAGNAANTGTGQIAKPAITNPSLASNVVGFELRFQDENNYELEVKELNENGTIQTRTLSGTYDATQEVTVIELPASLDMNGQPISSGVSVSFEGAPAAGDSFTLERATSVSMGDYAPTDMNLFDTLEKVIQALETPTENNPAAQAHLRNVLNGAMQRLDINYNNVLTVRASVGARLNEIDALNANGSLQSLHLSAEMGRLEDLDYFSASAQLELRKSALEAASLAFKKIQSTSLFALTAGG